MALTKKSVGLSSIGTEKAPLPEMRLPRRNWNRLAGYYEGILLALQCDADVDQTVRKRITEALERAATYAWEE